MSLKIRVALPNRVRSVWTLTLLNPFQRDLQSILASSVEKFRNKISPINQGSKRRRQIDAPFHNINPDLKLCKSIPSFKIKLKRELLQQFLDS